MWVGSICDRPFCMWSLHFVKLVIVTQTDKGKEKRNSGDNLRLVSGLSGTVH